jgi:hypothetical protein
MTASKKSVLPFTADPRILKERAQSERTRATADWVNGKVTTEDHKEVLNRTGRMLAGKVK